MIHMLDKQRIELQTFPDCREKSHAEGSLLPDSVITVYVTLYIFCQLPMFTTVSKKMDASKQRIFVPKSS